MTEHLARLAKAASDLEAANAALRTAILDALADGVPKLHVSKAARISRPTIDKLLAKITEEQ